MAGKSIHVKTRTTAILLHGIVRICDSLRFCDFRGGEFPARSLPDETQLRCQVTTVRATWQVHHTGAAQFLCGIIARRLVTFDSELTSQFILGPRPMHKPSLLAACELRLDRRARIPAISLNRQQANARQKVRFIRRAGCQNRSMRTNRFVPCWK